ncbi:MAG: hypothetical protein KatS3mg034_0818 [Vicingaceae bacterium]|jgi:hypothetical protein|nr:MAG: hypothetical protein KatS3mg034_0818 [Vicingaceae bacterium]
MKNENFGDMIKELLYAYGYGDRIQRYELMKHWEEIVGPQVARFTQDLKIKNGILWIKVDEAVVKDVMFHKRQEILERVNKILGNKITELKFL